MSEYKRDWKGFFRCPWKCGNTDFPQPKWKTEAGFKKHLEGCAMRPQEPPPPPPPPELVPWGRCSGCHCMVFEGETILKRGKNFLCTNCMYATNEKVKDEYLDCAGLVLGGFDDLVA